MPETQVSIAWGRYATNPSSGRSSQEESCLSPEQAGRGVGPGSVTEGKDICFISFIAGADKETFCIKNASQVLGQNTGRSLHSDNVFASENFEKEGHHTIWIKVSVVQ